MTKKWVDVKIKNIDLSSIPEPILEAADYLRDLSKEFGHYSNVRVRPHFYYENTELQLWGQRLETDAEYKKRLKKEKDAKEKRRIKRLKKTTDRRELYEELKKEFEG
jgi:hypothetical protein